MDFFRELSGRRVFNELQLILQEENPAGGRRAPERLRPAQGGPPRARRATSHARPAERGPAGPVLVRFAFPGRILYEVGRLFPGPDPPLRNAAGAGDLRPLRARPPGCRRSSWTAAPNARGLPPLADAQPAGRQQHALPPAGRVPHRADPVHDGGGRAGKGQEGHLALLSPTLRRTTISLKGEDLKALGVAPGPDLPRGAAGRPRRQAERARAARARRSSPSPGR
ncbi:MAG: hypothetical protein MZV70_07315 [Desulfobacterales bacterium]|nr:hypothetical protein [Desulfobacterales bacterium]